jgi:hypothetical protein
MVPDARGIPVDAHLRVGGRLWAIGDVTGLWPLTHVGKYQATLAIRARIPLDVLRDTIQPFPTFSEIYLGALKALHSEIATAQRVAEVAS